MLRNPEGDVVGLLAAVPIHEQTLHFLMRSPVSGAYFHSLSPDDLKVYRTAPDRSSATFIYSIDVENLEVDEQRSDILRLQFNYMLAGQIVLISPPPLDYYDVAYSSLGFERIPEAVHYDYDGLTPTSTFMLDTRREKLSDYIGSLIENTGGLWQASGPDSKQSPLFPGFTAREQEVAALLVRGDTNAEIAATLFISEAAVKKHVNSMLQKASLRNRTQLTKAILEREIEYSGSHWFDSDWLGWEPLGSGQLN